MADTDILHTADASSGGSFLSQPVSAAVSWFKWWMLIVLLVLLVVLAVGLGVGLGVGLNHHHSGVPVCSVLGNDLVFFIDPSTVYNGIDTVVSIYMTQSPANNTFVELTNNGCHYIASLLTHSCYSDVVLPQNTTVGFYDIKVTNGTDLCPATLAGGISVVSNASIAISSVVPAYVWVGTNSPITVTAVAGFIDTPRVFLASISTTTTRAATVLPSVGFSSSTILTAVIPAYLPLGVYTLIVLNPDGSVGVLQSAVHVVANPPPIITDVSPASLGGTFSTAVITGQNFNNASVSILCPTVSATPSSAIVAAGAQTSTSITFTMPSITGSSSSILCELIVTNGGDGSFGTFFSINRPGSSSDNLFGNSYSTSLNVARKAHSLVVGKPTASDRFVYAIGGDTFADGTGAAPNVNQTLRTVEFTNVRNDGSLGSWLTQSYSLPANGCTFGSAATIGKFVYLVCGYDGTAASTAIYRATILDPLNVPQVNVSVGLNRNYPGVPAGRFVYRISAVYPQKYSRNPNGESLPSEPVTIDLPLVQGGGVLVGLTWNALPHAISYNVYRSPTAGAASTDLVLLASTINLTLVDTGNLTTTSGKSPLPIGSLGQWSLFINLTIARYAFGLTVAKHPTAPLQSILYVGGGTTAAVAPTTSIESIVIQQVPQIQGSFDPEDSVLVGTASYVADLSVARTGLYATSVTSANNAAIASPNDTWVYFLGDATNNVVEAFRVNSTGGLVDYNSIPAAMQHPLAGYCAGPANDFLYVIGGSTSQSQGSSGKFCTSISGTTCAVVPPDYTRPNAGFSLLTARQWLACASDGIFQFFSGGYSGSALLSTVETDHCCA